MWHPIRNNWLKWKCALTLSSWPVVKIITVTGEANWQVKNLQTYVNLWAPLDELWHPVLNGRRRDHDEMRTTNICLFQIGNKSYHLDSLSEALQYTLKISLERNGKPCKIPFHRQECSWIPSRTSLLTNSIPRVDNHGACTWNSQLFPAPVFYFSNPHLLSKNFGWSLCWVHCSNSAATAWAWPLQSSRIFSRTPRFSKVSI